MLVVISPAKTLNFDTKSSTELKSVPENLNKSRQLVSALKKFKPKQLSDLMKISPKLGQLNFERYQEWNLDKSTENTKQAILAFKGDVYIGMYVQQFSQDDLEYAQEHLRILSGLHGILKPMDLIQAYRLEMGTKLSIRGKKNLYEFWGDLITKSINTDLNNINSDLLINLASDEYFKSINTKRLKARIITPIFKDFKNGSYKFLSFYGKKARGMMARYIIKNRVEHVDDLKLFEEDGYFYNDNLSNEDNLVFTRG